MPTLAKMKSGLLAKKEGQHFEHVAHSYLTKNGWYVVRIPDGGRMVGPNQFIRTRTPFDFMAVKHGRVVFFDTKSIDSERFNYAKITPHQLETLSRIESEGLKAGYLVLFRPTNHCAFFTGTQLKALEKRHSLTEVDGISFLNPVHLDFDKLFEVS